MAWQIEWTLYPIIRYLDHAKILPYMQFIDTLRQRLRRLDIKTNMNTAIIAKKIYNLAD